jgi:hypothetical protein
LKRVGLGLSDDEGWRIGLLLVGLPWTALAALALNGVGLVQLPFVLAWETVFIVIGALAIALNTWLISHFSRKVTRRWQRTDD